MNQDRSLWQVIYGLWICALLGCLVMCTSTAPKSEEYLASEAIAQRICSSCHLYTPPELLDQVTWPTVLSKMYEEMQRDQLVPDPKEWIKVQQFYRLHAPKAFHARASEQPPFQTLFTEKRIQHDSAHLSHSTMLSRVGDAIFIGQQNGQLNKLNNGKIESLPPMPNIPVHRSDRYLLGMGKLGPGDDVNGRLYTSDDHKTVVDFMTRPIHFDHADLDGDGAEEIIIAEFGTPTSKAFDGSLIITNPSGTKKVLDNAAGATQVKIIDIDKDGRKDIVALFGQGNEMIKAYMNRGDLDFEPILLVMLPPVYGTNSFDLADIDGDDDLDLLVTSGDNDDYSQVFKPYHGLRIFENQDLSFELDNTFDINGASKVKAVDFDMDGDADLVVLAMYPDLFNRRWEPIQYFENRGNGTFEQQIFSLDSEDNWILLEIADIDRDGDQDIITVANQSIYGITPPQLIKDWEASNKGIQIWENTAR